MGSYLDSAGLTQVWSKLKDKIDAVKEDITNIDNNTTNINTTIETLQDAVNALNTEPSTFTGSVQEITGNLVYGYHGDNPLTAQTGLINNKVKVGDKIQLSTLSSSGEEISSNLYTILNVSIGESINNSNTLKHKVILMFDAFNELWEIYSNTEIHKTSSETWFFNYNGEEYKLVPQNPVNTAGITKLYFEDVKPGDIFKVNNGPNSSTEIYVVLNNGNNIYDTTNYPDKAVIAANVHDGIVHILSDGTIVGANAETLNYHRANVVCQKDTIPIRDNNGLIDINGFRTSGLRRTLSSIGWYRIYTYFNNGNVGQNIKFTCWNYHDNIKGCSYDFNINLSYDNITINQFAAINNNSNLIDKIRIVRNSTNGIYVDIHYANTTSNDIYYTIEAPGYVSTEHADATIPDDCTSTEFTTVNGFKSQINDNIITFDDIKTTIDKRVWNEGYRYLRKGTTSATITTDEFIEYLTTLGAFNQSYYIVKGYWNYSNNDVIGDSGFGLIYLAGTTVEVFNQNSNNTDISYEIRLSTPSRVPNNNYYANSIFIYRYQQNGDTITKSWKRLVNSDELLLKGSTNNFTAWTAIPCKTKVYSGPFTTDVTINCTETMPVGDSVTLIMLNSTSSSHTINLTNFGVRNVDTITVPGGKRAEINLMALNTNTSDYHVRGINYED